MGYMKTCANIGLLFFLFAVLVFGQTSLTHITGTLSDSTATAFTGTMTVAWEDHFDNDGNKVVKGSRAIIVAAGKVDFLLPPSLLATSTAPNKTTYQYDAFGINTTNSVVYSSHWIVPIVPPSVAIDVMSIAMGIGSGGGGGGVTTFNGRAGIVIPTTGDYVAAQVTNAADVTGSYANPAWITSLAVAKISGTMTVLKGGTGVTLAQGNGDKVQLSTGPGTSGKCVEFDAGGNTVVAASNSACGITPSFISSIVDLQGTGSAVTMTGAAATIFFKTGVVLAAGQCLEFSFATTSSGVSATLELYADATLIYQIFSPSGSSTQGQIVNSSYCNLIGSLTSQIRFDRIPLIYGSGGNLGTNLTTSSSGAVQVPASVDWSTTHTISLKATASSGTVTGAWWKIVRQ